MALLRATLELRAELGIVVSVVHFNHRLRGEESDGDERFVRDLAHAHDLAFHRADADTKTFAREKSFSLEAAARELRYTFFGRLIQDGTLDKLATAHTLDDQAETVLLRVFRGTGTSGLAGILPRLKVGKGAIVRPILATRRHELLDYLKHLNQLWREDSTNAETTFTRNRLRHEVLPSLAEKFNPNLVQSLASLAEIARVEDEFWSAETAEAFLHCHHGNALDVAVLLKLHPALQRRVVRLAAIQAGATLDFPHTERILDLVRDQHSREDRVVELPNGFRSVVTGDSVSFVNDEPLAKPCGFSYTLPIPGEVAIPELRLLIRTSLITGENEIDRYNDDRRLDAELLPAQLFLRNWRPGDRFWPAHTRSEKKVKELLQDRHVPAREKSLWPVALAGNEIVWMRGFAVSARYAVAGINWKSAVLLEEVSLASDVGI